MKSSFRPSCPDDLSKLQQFLERAFGSRPGAPFVQPATMFWKYWEARDDWAEPRSYLLERDGAIVAFAGLWPMTFGIGSDAVRGVHMIDWASAKEAPGAGLTLVQKLAALFDFIVAIGGSDMTRKALPAFGFVEHAQQWTGAYPLRPFRQAMTHQSRNWKLAPRLARNLFVAGRRAKSLGDWHSKEIDAEEILPELYRADGHASPRLPAFFRYLRRCPSAQVALRGIFDGDDLRGHFVLTLVRGQARVAGVWLRKPERALYGVAYSLARIAARQMEGACEAIATGTGPVSFDGAVEAGFRARRDTSPVYLLNKKGKLALPQDFQFQLCDDDEAVLDTGSVSYWT